MFLFCSWFQSVKYLKSTWSRVSDKRLFYQSLKLFSFSELKEFQNEGKWHGREHGRNCSVFLKQGTFLFRSFFFGGGGGENFGIVYINR